MNMWRAALGSVVLATIGCSDARTGTEPLTQGRGDGGGRAEGDAAPGPDGATADGALPARCKPGALSCDGARILRCSADGSRKDVVERCPSTEACHAADGGATCGGLLCPAGAQACDLDNNTLLRCADDGLSVLEVQDCRADGLTCVAPVCQPPLSGTTADDGRGAWGACRADGDRCRSSTDCCNGLCRGNVCEACPSGRADCDDDGVRCETDLASPQSCGSCDRRCSSANGAPLCIDGECRMQVCQAGYADCDGDPDTGCEALLDEEAGDCKVKVCDGEGGIEVVADPSDRPPELDEPCKRWQCDGRVLVLAHRPLGTPCGADKICDRAGQCVACRGMGESCDESPQCCGGVCTGGHCGACPPGVGDCDGDPSACETPLNTPTDCGACGRSCSLPHASAACMDGRCVVQACEAGFVDCDLQSENGCEVELKRLDGCDPCSTGSSPECDALPQVATGTCHGGECVITSCQPGFEDCNGVAQDGCEADLSDPATCGSCGTKCEKGRCQAGQCRCNPGCRGAELCCDGACIPKDATCSLWPCTDPSQEIDRKHCGGCGARCDTFCCASAP